MLFVHESVIPASVARVFAFHEHSDALRLLTPPWERVEIIQPPTSLRRAPASSSAFTSVRSRSSSSPSTRSTRRTCSLRTDSYAGRSRASCTRIASSRRRVAEQCCATRSITCCRSEHSVQRSGDGWCGDGPSACSRFVTTRRAPAAREPRRAASMWVCATSTMTTTPARRPCRRTSTR